MMSFEKRFTCDDDVVRLSYTALVLFFTTIGITPIAVHSQNNTPAPGYSDHRYLIQWELEVIED